MTIFFNHQKDSMHRLLPFDTETTGLPDWKSPSDSPQQPHIVQLGAILLDGTTRKVLQSIDVIIKPDGWVIPVEASNVHGITTEKAMELGIPERDALAMFMEMWNKHGEQCSRIAFNESFDARIMRIAQLRNPDVVPEALAADWKVGRAECAMKMARPFCGLPKSPNLGEAYRHFTGQLAPHAHTAMGDTLAVTTVYFACIDNKAAGTAVPFALPDPATYPNGAPMYSKTTFKENGDPIMLDDQGKRSVFCDVADGDDEPATPAAEAPATA